MNAEAWLERFSEHLRLADYAESTVTSYRLDVRRFLEFLGGRGITEPNGITRDDVTAYRLLLHHSRKPNGEPLKAATQCSKLNAVLSFLRYLYRERFTLTNPGEHVKRPKVPHSLPPDVPDEEQVRRLLEAPDTSRPRGRRDRAILEVLYATAVRNAELRALRISDLDLHRLELDVRCGKGRKGRRLPLTEVAAVWLEEYLLRGRPALAVDLRDDTLFLNAWGGPLKADVLCRLVRKYSREAGLGVRVTPHILRHSFATHMLSRKAGLRHLQKLLGHADAGSTQVYTRVEVSDLREVLMQCHPRESC